MEKELSVDLEALQEKYDKDQAAAALQIKALHDKHSLTVKELSEMVELLEKEKRCEEDLHRTQILEMECKVKQLEQHLEEVSNIKRNDVLKESQLEHNILESEIQIQYQQLQEKHILLTSKVAELTTALNEANISLAMKEEDLASCTNCLTSTQAELAVTKTELEFLKSNPQPDGQKGNSLFAEVEDKRLNMKQRLDTILQKYHHLKKIYKDKCAELSRVNAEFVFVRRKCDEVLLETQDQEKHQVESYKARIKDLEERVQTLQKEKPPYVISSADNDTLKFVEAYVQSSRKECRKLKEELEARSVCALLSNETLFKTQRELQRKEVELIQAKVQIMELQRLLKEKEGRTEGSRAIAAFD
ncbi:hypothetical protein Cfor_06798 [Coptotermes formosanus]|uniref:Uncharacterized protein n=1 Tax=Coptotermes formosanus TaxID=36987 RepID=A0A6L2QCS7_COPFO|nr:hypothetical protein Cfor_06798 [Coptotermes formosanus]